MNTQQILDAAAVVGEALTLASDERPSIGSPVPAAIAALAELREHARALRPRLAGAIGWLQLERWLTHRVPCWTERALGVLARVLAPVLAAAGLSHPTHGGACAWHPWQVFTCCACGRVACYCFGGAPDPRCDNCWAAAQREVSS